LNYNYLRVHQSFAVHSPTTAAGVIDMLWIDGRHAVILVITMGRNPHLVEHENWHQRLSSRSAGTRRIVAVGWPCPGK
jgi:hypothetical protein